MNWVKAKWRGAEKGFQRELQFEINDMVKNEITNVFTSAQESFINDLPDGETATMPFITGNLHDSIVGIVSDNGMLVKATFARRDAVTTSLKTGNQIYSPTKGGGRVRIIGHQEAWKAVYGMQGKYPKKLAASMFVTVPYALNPNERGPHVGYLENLRVNYAAALDREFRYAAYKHVLAWRGNLNDYITLAYEPDDPRLVNPAKRRGRPKGSGVKMGSYRPGMGMKMMP